MDISLSLLLMGEVLLLGIVGIVAFAIFRSRPAPEAPGAAAEPPVEQTPPPTDRAPAAPPPFVDGGDDEEVTEETLAVVGNRPFLKRISGPATPKGTFFLSATGVTTIGRSRSNDIVLSEDATSSNHCRIEKQGNAFVLIDLESTNKTWVNGVEKNRVVLRNGDKVKIGDTTMIFALFGDRT